MEGTNGADEAGPLCIVFCYICALLRAFDTLSTSSRKFNNWLICFCVRNTRWNWSWFMMQTKLSTDIVVFISRLNTGGGYYIPRSCVWVLCRLPPKPPSIG